MNRRVSCPDLVGRAEELHLLDDAVELVTAGQATTVLVGGDAGIGKSRLVDELCRRARDHGALTATGVCIPIDGGLPYGPVVGVLRDAAGQLGADADALGLRAVIDQLRVGPPGVVGGADVYATGSRIADDLARTRLFESILACVAELARRSVVVLVFEDLHWADSASRGVLDFLIRNLADARVLLVGTYRSDELGRDHPMRAWLGELSRHGRVRRVGLAGLRRADVGALVAGIVGRRPDWALVEAVWSRSQGNPFLAEELTAARDAPSLPAELQDMIAARVERLSEPAQAVLRVVATAGPAVDHRLLAAVAPGTVDARVMDAALAEAVDSHILVVEPDPAGYRFRHTLLREAVASMVLPGERRRLHRAIALALAADGSLSAQDAGHRMAELATHWWAAGEWGAALSSSIAAADSAVAVLAFPEAVGHLQRALSALDRLPASEAPAGTDRLGLLERAADAAYLAGLGQPCFELARAAVDAVDATTDRATAARCHTLLGRNAWAVGDSAAAFDAYRQAAALLPSDHPSTELARVLAEEARGLLLLSRLREAEARCHEAVTVARAVGARAEEGHARNTLGCCRALLGHYDEGIELVQEALVIAEELGGPDDLNRAYGNLSSLLIDAGRLEEAAAVVFDRADAGEQLWGVRLNAAADNGTAALVRLGRYDEATALLAEIRDHGLGACAPSEHLLPAPMAIRCGRFDEAAELLAKADDLTAALADVQVRGGFHLLSAELALEEGRPSDAHDQVERALALTAGTDDETFGPEMCALGVRALADRHDGARAGRGRVDADKLALAASALVDDARRLVAAPVARGGVSTPRARALVAQCEAERSRLQRSDAALWDDAAGRWEAAREPYAAAYCRWRQAEALLEGRSGRAAAGDCLDRAWRGATRLGASPLRQRIEDLARRGRIPLGDDGATPPTATATVAADLGLTPREVEVLSHLATGRTDGEIAEALFISKKTVSVHVSSLLRKLDAGGRVEAGRIGHDHGLA